MSPSHNPTPPSPPPTYTPWSPPPSPTTIFRKSFRSFCAAENTRRSQRGEAPFCTPDGRDRAFAKLIRLSRGEEDYDWDGADWVDEVEDWYEEESVRMEERREREVAEAKEREERGEKMVKLHERKDSKEVDGGKQNAWGRVAMVMGLEMEGVRLNEDARVEYREIVDGGRK